MYVLKTLFTRVKNEWTDFYAVFRKMFRADRRKLMVIEIYPLLKTIPQNLDFKVIN